VTIALGIRWHTGATDELRVAHAIHLGIAKRGSRLLTELIVAVQPNEAESSTLPAILQRNRAFITLAIFPE
jgi:hypothetical protein